MLRRRVYITKRTTPVVKHSSILILLALITQFNLDLEQLDANTIFLHSDLDEEIYMTQQMGFNTVGKENLVCKLKKLLYVLKQSPRQWYRRFDKFMLDNEYTKSLYNLCVYFTRCY